MEPQNISISRTNANLTDFIAELAQMNGTSRSVENKIGFEQIHCAIKQRRVQDVCTDIAELLNYRWHDQDKVLQLYQPISSKIQEDNRYQSLIQTRLSSLKQVYDLLDIPEGQLRKLGQMDPQALQKQGGVFMNHVYVGALEKRVRVFIELLGSSSNSSLTELVSHFGYCSLKWTELTPVQQRLAYILAVPENEDSPQAARTALRTAESSGVRFTTITFDEHLNALQINVSTEFCLFRCLKSQLAHQSPRPVHIRPYENALVGREIKDVKLENTPFNVKAYQEEYPSIWLNAFQQLSRLLPYSLYSDAIPSKAVGESDAKYIDAAEQPTNPASLHGKASSVAQVLNHLCRVYGKVWWRKEDAIFFRSKHWYQERKSQYPPAYYKTLEDSLRKNGAVTATDILGLAKLTRHQLRGLRLYALERSYKLLGVREVHELDAPCNTDHFLLRFFSTLSAVQQDKVLTKPGLPLSEMKPLQKKAFHDALSETKIRRDRILLADRFAISQSLFTARKKEDYSLNIIKYECNERARTNVIPAYTGVVFKK